MTTDLAGIGDVTSRAMFGGYGIFASGVMFALVDSAGSAFLRTDQAGADELAGLGAERHARMPYWSVPPSVAADAGELERWAGRALEVARAASR